MKLFKISSPYIFAAILLYGALFAYDSETKKIMPFIASKSECVKCHDNKKIRVEIKSNAMACDPQCAECHREMDKHHSVGMRPVNKPEYAFRLTSKNKIACVTCHDLRKKRYSGMSWRSESLFEKIFKGKDRYNTYYLIMNNSDGDLCRQCH